MDGRVDLPVVERPPAGHGARRARTKAVSLSRALRAVRDETKFSRLLDFGEALPRIARWRSRPGGTGLPRRRCSPPSSGCSRRPDSRGQRRVRQGQRLVRAHDDSSAGTRGSRAQPPVRFRGKSGGATQSRSPIPPRPHRPACQELPGQAAFPVPGREGRRQASRLRHEHYLRETTGAAFTAKDFRTWAGTVLAARALEDIGRATDRGPAERQVVQAVDAVSQVLGNTRAVCRKCYVHPAVIDAYMDGSLPRMLRGRGSRRPSRVRGLSAFESGLLGLLQRRQREWTAGRRLEGQEVGGRR